MYIAKHPFFDIAIDGSNPILNGGFFFVGFIFI